MNVNYKDFKREFTKYGDNFKCIAEKDDIYIFERITIGDNTHNGYEVVKMVKRKNKDGSVVMSYPQSSEWGFGRAVSTRNYDKALQYLNNRIERISY